MARWEKHGTTSNGTLIILFYWSRFLRHLGSFVYPLRSLVEVVEYRVWLDKRFGKIPVYKHKQALLDAIILKASEKLHVTYHEFGVAFGETADYLTRNTSIPFIYHGYDTFEGLPKAWRRLPKGAITNYGKTPDIFGGNVHFHKGLINETINLVDFESQGIKCILFDFDLYEPTLFAYKHIKNQLNPGDIVYFDEAFDSEERIIIENYFLDDFKFAVLGASVFGIAFELI
jgi:hypothetical protein